MRVIITVFLTSWMAMFSQSYIYNPYHQHLMQYSIPYYNSLGGYANHLHHGYSQFIPPFQNLYPQSSPIPYIPQPNQVPTLNVLAEVPYTIKNNFTVVSMYAMARENLNIISDALIIQASREKPTLTIKIDDFMLTECTPAVKVLLDKPLIIYSLKTSIIFPSEIEIAHEGYKILIEVGAVIAPIPHDTFVSIETPFPITSIYAIPTKPFVIDYITNTDVLVNVDNQAVIVENDNDKITGKPPKNVTVLEFPDVEAEPIFQVDEDDDELVNRNPPIGIIPAGIVQSTQPLVNVQSFTNSKESPLLTTLREEAAKNRNKVDKSSEGVVSA